MLLMEKNKDTHCSGRILKPDPCSIKALLGLTAPLSPLQRPSDTHSSAGFPLFFSGSLTFCYSAPPSRSPPFHPSYNAPLARALPPFGYMGCQIGTYCTF
ncbi:uncharacterized [Tachysurus ichikawai]